MACTGLPNPQADHAPRMVKFARDCMVSQLLPSDLLILLLLWLEYGMSQV
jgi:hypothetical protein